MKLGLLFGCVGGVGVHGDGMATDLGGGSMGGAGWACCWLPTVGRLKPRGAVKVVADELEAPLGSDHGLTHGVSLGRACAGWLARASWLSWVDDAAPLLWA